MKARARRGESDRGGKIARSTKALTSIRPMKVLRMVPSSPAVTCRRGRDRLGSLREWLREKRARDRRRGERQGAPKASAQKPAKEEEHTFFAGFRPSRSGSMCRDARRSSAAAKVTVETGDSLWVLVQKYGWQKLVGHISSRVCRALNRRGECGSSPGSAHRIADIRRGGARDLGDRV